MNIAVVLSGGTGTRVGSDIPKQYIEVYGRPVIAFCLDTLARSEKIDAIQIVVLEEWQQYLVGQIQSLPHVAAKFNGFSDAGETRQLSILNALHDLKTFAKDTDYVLIHDAARPFLSQSLIDACFDTAKDYDGVLPVLPMKDTVYASLDGRTISGLLNREQIFAGQAPEVFVLGKYLEANMALFPDKILTINGSTEPAILAGMNIAMIPGDEMNFKITIASDLERFTEIIRISNNL